VNVVTTEPRLYTLEQVASLLSLGRSHLYRLMTAGKIRPVKVGKSVRVSRDELQRFVHALQEEADEAAS
jgi:excisionase family DNA binding protein